MTAEKTSSVQTVALVTDGSSFTVAPGQAVAYPGDQIVFHNLTNEPATIIFPDDRLFGKTTFPADPGGTASADISDKFALFGSYPYAVYFPNRREFAHASMPIIIIYPTKP
jgi:hypothetical protein